MATTEEDQVVTWADLWVLKGDPLPRPAEQYHRITWREIMRLEPRLRDLYREAKAERDTGGASYCANRVWYTRYKPRLLNLVGWEAAVYELRTQRAYDVAYKKVYNVLPACRDCWCF